MSMVNSSDVSWRLDGINMEGTVVRPAGDGPFPAVVLVAGSGPTDRGCARYPACPPGVAAFTFALITSTSNFGAMFSTAIGGRLYQFGLERHGAATTFQFLVALGALCTAACWFVVPFLRRTVAR